MTENHFQANIIIIIMLLLISCYQLSMNIFDIFNIYFVHLTLTLSALRTCESFDHVTTVPPEKKNLRKTLNWIRSFKFL